MFRFPNYAGSAVALAVLAFTGCGDRPATYPVRGVVVFADGSPMTGGMVEFVTPLPDGTNLNARGQIDPAGAFTLGTFEDGDGAIAGEHRAVVISLSPFNGGDVSKQTPTSRIAARFQHYDTSELKFTVRPGKNALKVLVAEEE